MTHWPPAVFGQWANTTKPRVFQRENTRFVTVATIGPRWRPVLPASKPDPSARPPSLASCPSAFHAFSRSSRKPSSSSSWQRENCHSRWTGQRLHRSDCKGYRAAVSGQIRPMTKVAIIRVGERRIVREYREVSRAYSFAHTLLAQGGFVMRASSATAKPASRIVRTKGICGGLPRVAGTRFPVWVLVSYRKQGMSNDEILKLFPTLSRMDLVAAWKYASQKPDMANRRK